MTQTVLLRNRAILVWALAAFGFATAVYDYAAGLNAGFSFDLRCDLRGFPQLLLGSAREAVLNSFDIPLLHQHFDRFIL